MGLFESLMSKLDNLTERNVRGTVDTTMQYIRVQPLQSCIFTFAFYFIASWLIGWRKQVDDRNKEQADLQVRVPRIYVSDSSWLDRSIDVFRSSLGGCALTLKGYKMVLTVQDISNWHIVPERLF